MKRYIQQLKATARKKSKLIALDGKSTKQITDEIRTASGEFLFSLEWKALRKKVLDFYGTRCMKCGRTPKNPSKVNVDHIKPRKLFPDLALVFDNLQVLCARCNKHKGNKNCNDYRTLGRTMEE